MKLPENLTKKLRTQYQKNEERSLGQFAFHSKDANRKNIEDYDYRSPFTRDADRILHSLSFARFFDKTQCFFWYESDMHQHRMLHVQLVSKMSREIAEVLNLNQNLVEAISLGHDIGHVPFGHDGEDILSEICIGKGIGEYHHNFGSVWFLQEIEMQNLTLPVLDGILCHNGESHQRILKPSKIRQLSWKDHYKDMERVRKRPDYDPNPKTMEGSLVRIIDTVSYISRDILDAENLGLLKFSDIPNSVKNVLGSSNREIINNLVTDLILTSLNKPYIGYSKKTFSALQELYKFNYKNIYTHPDKFEPLKTIEEAFKLLFDHYYDDLINNKQNSKIFSDHLELNLKQIKNRYPEINSLEKYSYTKQPAEIIVRDFIAGMTDQYFWYLAQNLEPSLKIEKKIIL